MTDITITPANVVKGSGAKTKQGVLGETVTAGQLLYYDESTQKYLKSDGDSATAEIRTVAGIALNGGGNNQPVVVLFEGPLTIGGTVVKGTVYAMSDVAGGIRPISDNASGDYVSTIGIAISTSVIDVRIHNSGANI